MENRDVRRPPRRTDKVVCYVTTGDHLLVVTHLDVPLTEAGVQVPAGTMERGETAREAALREVQEETGLADLSMVGVVGRDLYDIAPTRDEMQHRRYVHLTTQQDVSQRWLAGELDPDGGGEPQRWECWWLPLMHAHVLAAGQGRFVHRIGRR
ncbi:NUDIX domain-containing protein [Kytococcus sedentarius]|uniref:NUDIX domain-containing protein n=1 Tax=Kytococcus sedentarius TaxID=1276 RepID=UPI0035BC37D3